LLGGIDIVMSAKAGASARSPLNISPGTVDRARVVAISMSTFGDCGDVLATGVNTSFGCPPHPGSAMIIEHTTNQRNQLLGAHATSSPMLPTDRPRLKPNTSEANTNYFGEKTYLSKA
jgi:hypothetical protein